jgi:hypothetical protein
MTRLLSPVQCMILNGVWIVGFAFLVLFLGRDGDLEPQSIPLLNVLFFLGPVVCAALCDRLSGPLLGALGFAGGAAIVAVVCLVAVPSVNVDWTRIVFLPLVSVANLTVTVPVWWLSHRCRRPKGHDTSSEIATSGNGTP